jgi:hypothetical protein
MAREAVITVYNKGAKAAVKGQEPGRPYLRTRQREEL